MATFNDLVVVEGLVELLHARRKFTRVHGADAVVFGGGEDERFRVVFVGPQVVVGRDGSQKGALLGYGD